ncbi:MAG: GTPase Era [Bacilli bacterium]
MKSGFVGLIGRPNVGKSTLMNSILGKKIAITSNKPQTTRNIIQGIYNEEDTQIIFVDTPGIHKPKSKLGKFLNEEAYFSINDVDVILFIVDVKEDLGKGDLFIIDLFKEINTPIILVLNKIDKLTKEEILLKIDEYKDLYNFCEIVPVSALKKDNVDRLVTVIKKYLKDNIRYFPTDIYTSSPITFIISELIREKIFELTDEEIPHSVTTLIENIEETDEVVSINGLIIVDRENLKKIIIGKQGSMIKEIGTKARIDIETLLGKKVYLELFVKVIPKWKDKEKYLKELGFNSSDFE